MKDQNRNETWKAAYEVALKDGCTPSIAQTIADFALTGKMYEEVKATATRQRQVIQHNLAEWQRERQKAQRRKDYVRFHSQFNSVGLVWPNRQAA